MADQEPRVPVAIRLRPETLRRLDAAAERAQRTRSDMARVLLGEALLPHRMVVESGDYGGPWLTCACGWSTLEIGYVLHLDDLAAVAAEHYRTADQPGLIPAATTTPEGITR